MDHEAMLPHPLAEVFAHLATPSRLADWLPGITGVRDGAAVSAGIGVEFGLRLCCDGRETPATGELIAYEPPWCVAYRLLSGADRHVLRLTCTASGTATRVHVHQADSPAPLAVDLDRLRQVLGAAGRPG
ncbi:MAG TPA: SRPBCC family protein [Streptosporangiaceae bacterium]|jgi:uncharacterized protein YndB with AHSA1/START domain